MADLLARTRLWLEEHEDAVAWTAVALAFALFVADTARTRPLLHEENWRQLPFYGRSRGLGLWAELTKIFDVCALDDCFWRNRPVNFLLELLDTKLLMLLNALGAPWGLHSVSRIVLVPATAAFVAAGLRGIAPALPRASAWVWGAAFATSGQVLATAAVIGRPAKLWAAFGTAVVFWTWARFSRAPVLSRAALCSVPVLCVVVLGDEQSVFMLAAFLALDAWRIVDDLRSGVKPARLGGAFLAAGISGLAFWAFNFAWAGPRLVQAFSTGTLERSWSDPRSFLRLDIGIVDDVASTLAYQLGAVLGDWWDGGWVSRSLTAAGLLLALAALRGTKDGATAPHRRYLGTALAAAIALMVYVMGTRHWPVLAIDIRRLPYYQATAVATLVALALWFERRGGLATPARRFRVSAALMAFSVSAFLATPRTKVIALSRALDASKPLDAAIWRLIEDPSSEASLPAPLERAALDFAHFAQGFVCARPK